MVTGILLGFVFSSIAGGTVAQQHDQVSGQFRERRMNFFLNRIRNIPRRPARILDLGGTMDFWQRQPKPEGFSITVLNVFEQSPVAGVEVVLGDACDLGRYPDKFFDVVFSNSVIGHVGDWERQQQMAREIRRVARRYFVQTPNQDFPVDWRTLVPFFHWLSPQAQAWWFQRVPVGRYRRVQDAAEAFHLASRVRNLNRAEVQELFPEAKIFEERVAGLVKSFIIHHGFDQAEA